jgi:AcrR family transcriptional regulator
VPDRTRGNAFRHGPEGEALRGELLAVAGRLLETGGTGAVTTRAVAAGAGTSLAAVNELFGGKAGLVRALFGEGVARLAADLRALAATASQIPRPPAEEEP